MKDEDAFLEWYNRDWVDEPICCSMERARSIFLAGRESTNLPAIQVLWLKIRSEINSPEAREMDRVLGAESKPLSASVS